MYLRYFIDFMVGGLITLILAYYSDQYKTNPAGIKIVAYLWGIPVFFFYLLYIASRNGKNAMRDFIRHGMLGAILSTCSMLVSLCILGMNSFSIVFANIGMVAAMLFGYFHFKVYNKL